MLPFQADMFFEAAGDDRNALELDGEHSDRKSRSILAQRYQLVSQIMIKWINSNYMG
jgi:hypothetical protein